jgi:hypothetical protein
MALGIDVHGEIAQLKIVPIIAQEIDGMKLKRKLAYHDVAYLILCIYERDVIYDEIIIMHMNENNYS